MVIDEIMNCFAFLFCIFVNLMWFCLEHFPHSPFGLCWSSLSSMILLKSSDKGFWCVAFVFLIDSSTAVHLTAKCNLNPFPLLHDLAMRASQRLLSFIIWAKIPLFTGFLLGIYIGLVSPPLFITLSFINTVIAKEFECIHSNRL